ncbi:hypothetical protein COV42_02645 [Candidatus Campbellbacteria bacterium CG11_big_fil_rev_8_21_14_0_20_44_21]|uniref:Uncharacterized protein n=1 Tax=Candidatus Campbellbacteria bacterium CG22_combo_CG10-13_8_21_14_all_43_18 TaxID=1974530 RepID=A0A2H0DXB4_9BACT|nr:MAG: hypothetical protein COW82_00020 [Candidatus Campbellbacteria bacterium CG22_combo_CG10-13_8_21_14_all_43_18]PIR24079.1 MAG: hypothetical protein COV42_02645 [Candidatus Campbellbacteria bacterium CG11_big_fil_rev_8_21_14_0_20_44_21]
MYENVFLFMNIHKIRTVDPSKIHIKIYTMIHINLSLAPAPHKLVKAFSANFSRTSSVSGKDFLAQNGPDNHRFSSVGRPIQEE